MKILMFRRARLALLAASVALGMTVFGAAGASAPAAAAASFPNVVVPVPVAETADGSTFTLAPAATLTADDANVGGYLAGILRASTGYALPLTVGATTPGTIALSLSGAPSTVGAEGYQLTIT